MHHVTRAVYSAVAHMNTNHTMCRCVDVWSTLLHGEIWNKAY